MQAILPFLLEVIPSHIAAYGIGKKNPKLGRFIHAAQIAGYSSDAIMGYLRNKLNPAANANISDIERRDTQGIARPDEMAELQHIKSSQLPADLLQKGVAGGIGALAGLGVSKLGEQPNEKSQLGEELNEKPKTNANTAPQITPLQEEQMEPAQPKKSIPQGILEALSPKLKQFVEDRLSKGHPLAKIANLAQDHFFDEINQIEEESGMDFHQLLESLYGKQRETSRVMGLQNQQSNQVNQTKIAFLEGLKQLNQSLGG